MRFRRSPATRTSPMQPVTMPAAAFKAVHDKAQAGWAAYYAERDGDASEPVRGGFVAQYRTAIFESDLRSTLKLVALVMAEHADYRTGGSCRPGADRISAFSGLSRATVCRARRELESAGWIELVGSRGSSLGSPRASTYQLRIVALDVVDGAA